MKRIEQELIKEHKILGFSVSQQEERVSTVLGKMDVVETHMRLCLKDVKTMQHEVGKFRERIEFELKQYNEANQILYS